MTVSAVLQLLTTKPSLSTDMVTISFLKLRSVSKKVIINSKQKNLLHYYLEVSS